jgi:hypothetical protein
MIVMHHGKARNIPFELIPKASMHHTRKVLDMVGPKPKRNGFAMETCEECFIRTPRLATTVENNKRICVHCYSARHGLLPFLKLYEEQS